MYATFDDLLAANIVDVNTLIRLTDINDIGEVDQQVCESALAAASEYIDGYIGEVYELPLAEPVPVRLKGLCIDIAIYNLFGSDFSAGALWTDRMERAQKYLEQIMNGNANLGADDPAGTGHRHPSFFSSKTDFFSRFTI